jgi:protoheme IX farnesyltransferase
MLGLLVILWTPPHFWSLALFHKDDYRRAGVPMLPVVKGEEETHRRIAVYTGALVIASFLFIIWEELDALYLMGATLLNVPMLVLSAQLAKTGLMATARSLFRYSNIYLMLIFALLMTDAVLLSMVT